MAIELYTLVGADETRPFSPHCWKVEMALAHKGLDFKTNPTPFTKVPEVENNLGPIVPVMRDGETVLSDSFKIALYLEEIYPDAPSLFGGEGGKAMARFVESWSNSVLHPAVVGIILMDIYNILSPEDQAYFRKSREARFGKTLEELAQNRAANLEAFEAKIKPLELMLKTQDFLGGNGANFADYIIFGALQWARVSSDAKLLDDDHLVSKWFGRCLDLHDGFAKKVAAAA